MKKGHHSYKGFFVQIQVEHLVGPKVQSTSLPGYVAVWSQHDQQKGDLSVDFVDLPRRPARVRLQQGPIPEHERVSLSCTGLQRTLIVRADCESLTMAGKHACQTLPGLVIGDNKENLRGCAPFPSSKEIRPCLKLGSGRWVILHWIREFPTSPV